MTGKRIIYYLLAAFIAGNAILIYIQYNSAKNIDILIDGNEKVLAEINVTNTLRELNREVVAIEAKKTGPESKPDTIDLEGTKAKLFNIQSAIDNLQKISDDDTSVKYVDVLDLLVHEKLDYLQVASGSILVPAVNSSHLYIDSAREKTLNDSIRLVTHTIENSRQKILSKVTSEIDRSGKNALALGTALIIIVVICGAVLFWFIITAIRKQNLLIRQLDNSEKEVRKAAQVKEKFIANMSHEIRTPLNAIIGFTDLLKRKKNDAEAQEYIKTIQRSGENLLTIINDILDLSKLEAGMMRIEAAPFNIRELLNSLEMMFRPKASEKNLQLSVNVDAMVPNTLEGDATRLTQILINLIGNAIKFTPEGSIWITITNEGADGSSIKIGISITDTGIGVEKEKLQYIFERFQQAEDSVARKFGGTGLGLSIVKDLVQLQHGTINIESEPGMGTTFQVVLPFRIPLGTADNKAEAANRMLTDFTDVLILVVEDNEINQSLIKHLFKNWKLEFELVKNGKEAIEKLKKKKYDLVLMDIQMPVMDGYSATLEIRHNLNLDTPIIAMTAHAMEGEREKCLSYGMDEYISKPIREELLHKLIARYTMYIPEHDEETQDLPGQIIPGAYQYINLEYMKEISQGNKEYEQTVTEQFMETIPLDLVAIEKGWLDGDNDVVKKTAHNMKTSISVMGLNEILQPCLDALEYDDLNDTQFQQRFSFLSFICKNAFKEARFFMTTLK